MKANLIEILRHEKETLLDALKSWKAGMVFDAEQFSSVQRLLDEVRSYPADHGTPVF